MGVLRLDSNNKTLALGTALWGWGVSRKEAFHLLEQFLLAGGRLVDTATNYPINKRREDFGLAQRWIAEWQKCNGDSGLSLLVKIGSVDNMGSPDVRLSPDHIRHLSEELRIQFGAALACVSVHWDDRQDPSSISSTVQEMSRLAQEGLSVGLSGIRNPEWYFRGAPALAGEWIIQVKENFMTHAARLAYEPWFPNAKYLAYGINLGGVKVEPPQGDSSIKLRQINIPQTFKERLVEFIQSAHPFEPRPTTLNELALAASYVNPALSGVVIGPRNIDQLDSTLSYWAALKAYADCAVGRSIMTRLSESG